MDKILKELGINAEGKWRGDIYTVPIETYDEFSILYNKLEQSDLLQKDSESKFNIDTAWVNYTYDDYKVTLNGDLNADVYELSIKEI